MPQEMNIKSLPDGDVAICMPQQLNAEQIERIRAQWGELFGPGRKAIVLCGGATIQPLDNARTLARIESKLDALLSALADEENQKPGLTLDGDPAGEERQGGLDLG